jgi:hypothetical protein
MRESIGLRGEWTIEIRRDGELIRTLHYKNQLTAIYQGSVLNQLKGNSAVDLSIKYIAIGTDGTTATANDTQLHAEVFRSTPTSKTIMDGYMQTIWVLTPAQGNVRIREIGVFAGDATLEADSGSLLSRMVVDIEKTENIEITMIRRDYVTI